MKQLSLDALRAFVSVVELQSYTAAGQLLGRSQPAISLQLQRLEEQLGQPLVQRQRGRIGLTTAGQELLDSARQMLALNDQVFARFEHQGVRGRVRLGIPSEFASKLLPRLLGQFAQSYPNVALEVTSALSKDLLDERAQRRYDLIIALQEPFATNPKTRVLKQEPLVWVGADERFAERLTAKQIALVAAPDGCIYRKRALSVLAQHDIGARISFTNADFAGLTAAIRSGLGITVLAQSTVPDDLLVLDKLPEKLPELGTISIVLQLNIAAHEPDHAAVQYLADYLSDYLQTSGL